MASEENVSDVKRKLWSAAGTGRVWNGWVFTAAAWEVIGIGVSGQEMAKLSGYHCIPISVEELTFDE